jgi:tRNA pseudouridine55 synthase
MSVRFPTSKGLPEGVLLVDKEEGESSFSPVKRLRKVLGLKKVGHAGTLDPFATGLLVVLLGQGTKLSPFLMAGNKKYCATFRLGVETDTLDLTGRVVRVRPVPAFDEDNIREKVSLFLGDVEQLPPSYSAVKHEGRRAYELARKGIRFDLRKRKVRIHHLKVLSADLPDLTLLIECSPGTYIRSLGADLGEALGTGAHVRALRRLTSGSFTVQEAVRLRDFSAQALEAALKRKIIPLKEALPELREQEINPDMALKIRNGFRPKWKDLSLNDPPVEGLIKLVSGPDLVAVAELPKCPQNETIWLELLRVFH